jgi:hypothetical protein
MTRDINTLRTIDSDFAQSLCAQFDRNGSLSDKQWFWCDKLTAERVARDSRPDAPAVDLKGVVDLLTDARQHLKFPKVTISTEAGQIVVLKLAGNRARQPGTVNVVDDRPFGDNSYFGRIHIDGTFEVGRDCTDEIVELLTSIADDPAAAASTHGHLTGNCCFCRKVLTDERSTSVGYGPTCASNFGLAWGSKVEAAEVEIDDADEEPADRYEFDEDDGPLFGTEASADEEVPF